tara:strand:+ start:7919 stop:8377 length:459 start_codon:yes stop_codon:yes gene_type:complete
MKLGVLFDDFLKNDKNYGLMKVMNDYVLRESENVCAFVVNMSNKIIPSNFPYMGISDIGHFENGVLVATTLNTADALNKTACNSQKILYLWNFEWVDKTFNFYGIQKILSNENLYIVVRSQLQADLLKHNFNIEVDAIQKDFNLEQLNEVCT